MAIAQRGSAYTGTYSTTGAYVIPFPTGTAAGDYLVLLISTGSGTATLTGPPAAGWAEHVNADTSTTKIGLWSKVVTSSDVSTGSVSVTRSVAAVMTAILTAWSGSTGFDTLSAQTTHTTTTAVVPAVTPVAANCLQLVLGTARPATANVAVTHTVATGFTGRGEGIDTGTGNRRMVWQDSVQLAGQAGVAQPTANETLSTASTGAVFSLTMAPQVGGAGAVTGGTASTGTVDAVVGGTYRGFNDFDTAGRVAFDATLNPSAETAAAGYTGNGLEVATANAPTRQRWSSATFGATKRYGAITFRLRFRALPLTANLGGTSAAIMTSKNSTPNSGTGQGHFGMFFQPTDNKLHWDLTATSNGASTMVFAPNEWHLVQAKWDYGSATYTADIQIDGITQPGLTSTGMTPYYVAAMGFGSDQSNQTYGYDVDSVLFAASTTPLAFLTLPGDVTGATASAGTVAGRVGVTGAVTGGTASIGTVAAAAAAGAVTGSVTGSTATGGTAAGQVGTAGAATGGTASTGTPAGVVGRSSSTTGSTASTGAVAATVGRSSSATGSTASTGTVDGSVTAAGAGAVTGGTMSTGTVSGSVAASAAATGGTASTGTVSGNVAITATATGSTSSNGVIAATTDRPAAAAGSTASTGVVIASTGRAGAVAGVTSSSGTVIATVAAGALVSGASGSTATGGTVAGRVGIAATVTGGTASVGTVAVPSTASRGILRQPVVATGGPRPAGGRTAGPRPMIST